MLSLYTPTLEEQEGRPPAVGASVSIYPFVRVVERTG